MPTSSPPEPQSWGIIGGSGLYRLSLGTNAVQHAVQTPYAASPCLVEARQLGAQQLFFLPRHGVAHTLAPHQINYRANLWALRKLGVGKVLAINSVGGIAPGLIPGRFVVPDQLIDYTHGRESSFAGADFAFAQHVEFTQPFDAELSQALAAAAGSSGVECRLGAVYGCTQGPRLETAAEIRRLRQDGCDVVGMTAMPEAVLARELGLRYAMLALVVNRAAGLSPEPLTGEAMGKALESGMASVPPLLQTFFTDWAASVSRA